MIMMGMTWEIRGCGCVEIVDWANAIIYVGLYPPLRRRCFFYIQSYLAFLPYPREPRVGDDDAVFTCGSLYM